MTQSKGFHRLLRTPPPTTATQMTKLPKTIKYKLGQMGCKMAGTGIFSMETVQNATLPG